MLKGKSISCLLCAGWLLTTAAFAQSAVTLAVDARFHGCLIPDDFAGIGFETYAELPNRSGVSGNLFSPANTQLVTLFTNTGIRNLRLGGGTVDGLHAAIPSRADIDNVFGFARATGLKVIYSLPLLDGNAADDAATAKYIWTHYQPYLDCFAIGNEPDVRKFVYPPFGMGTDPAITNYESCLAKWRILASAITNVLPEVTFTGPDAAGRLRAQQFSRDEKNSKMVTLITQHFYIGGWPNNTTPKEAIDKMLSPKWVNVEYPSRYQSALAPVAADGLPFRLTESNDYIKGIAGASDSFASALWALDYLHWWAKRGCSGVNFHNNEWYKTDTIYLDDSGNYRVNPKAYAIRAFDLGSHGWVEPVVVDSADDLNLTAYAVGDGTNLCVTIINKEHGIAPRNAVVTIAPNGVSLKSAKVMFLTAPNNDAGATNGITLGGASITNNVPWQRQWTALSLTTNHQCEVMVLATSAAVVKLFASEQK